MEILSSSYKPARIISPARIRKTNGYNIMLKNNTLTIIK